MYRHVSNLVFWISYWDCFENCLLFRSYMVHYFKFLAYLLLIYRVNFYLSTCLWLMLPVAHHISIVQSLKCEKKKSKSKNFQENIALHLWRILCFIFPLYNMMLLTPDCFPVQESKSKEMKMSYDLYLKVLFLSKVLLEHLKNFQVNVLPWLSLKSLLVLLFCRFLLIWCLFTGFGGFLLQPYLSNLCNPLVIPFATHHFTTFVSAPETILDGLADWLISLWHPLVYHHTIRLTECTGKKVSIFQKPKHGESIKHLKNLRRRGMCILDWCFKC